MNQFSRSHNLRHINFGKCRGSKNDNFLKSEWHSVSAKNLDTYTMYIRPLTHETLHIFSTLFQPFGT